MFCALGESYLHFNILVHRKYFFRFVVELQITTLLESILYFALYAGNAN